MNIALHHFRLVDTISKEGSLTKAASALHLTQSALSHQLKELEKELDIEVFHRQGKKLQLTEVGYRFLRSSEKILAEIRTLKRILTTIKMAKPASSISVCNAIRHTTGCPA
ncbi:LysR family transcriptional regulator [Mucilaginibacter sp. UC70_90]